MKILIIIISIIAFTFGNEDGTQILSRKKRFLVFPDGSSFQLVFCTQTHGYLQVGDIVWFGHTAALAWELPTDPTLFHMFKDKEKVYGQRRQDSKLLVFLDENGKVISTKPYKRKPIVNPAFAKRSIANLDEENMIKLTSIKKMHELQKNISIFQDLDERTITFHRDGRKSLYAKLETFFQALGLNGKDCLLRMLCESGKANIRSQGTFYEEILRATFTMPQIHKSGLETHEYDVAHRSRDDCATLYPKCEKSSLRM